MQIRDEPLVLSHLRNFLRERKGEREKKNKNVWAIYILQRVCWFFVVLMPQLCIYIYNIHSSLGRSKIVNQMRYERGRRRRRRKKMKKKRAGMVYGQRRIKLY